MDLFSPIVPEVKLNQSFLKLKDNILYSPAKELISQVTSNFKDKDGNFIEQFQTTGYEARIWELFLDQFFVENGFFILTAYDRPDYNLYKNNNEVFVEATASFPTDTNEKFTDDFIKDALKKKDVKIQEEILDHYIIKMAGVLYSKMKKEYWKLSWVQNKPLIFAIKPSHHLLADFIPDYKVISYLYGKFTKTYIDENGHLKGWNGELIDHKYGAKVIPSGFFSLPDSENISAVIFSNEGTTKKFNRLGKQNGLGDQNVSIVRAGNCFDPTPGAGPKSFNYSVGDGQIVETWSNGVSIFHNPNAKIPLDRNLFEGCRQVWLNGEKYDGFMPEFFPFHSITGSMYLP
jgi:hypothetical protein